MLELVWLIPALPLAGFLVLLVARPQARRAAGRLARPRSLVAARSSPRVVVFLGLLGDDGERAPAFTQTLFEWLPAGGFRVDVGFLVDPLSITMCLFITGVGALIHLYSIGYMHGDPTVLEVLRLPEPVRLLDADAGAGRQPAPHLPRVGGRGRLLLLADLVLARAATPTPRPARRPSSPTASATGASWSPCSSRSSALGSINYVDIIAAAPAGWPPTTATAIAVLLFVGAVGKSAQLPLFVWLPDAMAGPTPVSALIHAATMVTAGVYLMIRVNPVLAAASPTGCRTIIALVGAVTALFAATIAVGPERHQEGAGVLDGQPARLHVPGRRLGRLRRRHLPHGHPRLLQGAAVPRLRLGHPRHGRRAGHAAHGRPRASTCRSPPSRSSSAGWPSPACRRSPASGRRTRSCSTPGTRAARLRAVGRRPRHRPAHRLLHDPPGLPDLLRRGPLADAEARRRRGRAVAERRGRRRRRRRRPTATTVTTARSTPTSRRGR